MSKLSLFLTTLLFTLASSVSYADCSLEQTICETSCNVRYINDTFGKMGCMTKCAAERGVCSTKSGAKTATEKTKELIKD